MLLGRRDSHAGRLSGGASCDWYFFRGGGALRFSLLRLGLRRVRHRPGSLRRTLRSGSIRISRYGL